MSNITNNLTLLDIDNEVILVPLSLVYKSTVLKSFYEKNSGKAFKLDYPRDVVLQMLDVMKNTEDLILSDILIELCQQMDIPDIVNYIDNSSDSFETEVIPDKCALYVFKNMWFKHNEQYYQTRIIKNVEPVVKLTMKNGTDKVLLPAGYNLQNSSHNVLLSDFQNHCHKEYIKEYQPNYCNHDHKEIPIPIDDVVTEIPGEKVSIKTFNVGKLVSDKLPDIKLNKEIFDEISKLLVKYYDNDSSYTVNTKNHNMDPRIHRTVLEIQRNYEKFIVKLKIVEGVYALNIGLISKILY